MTRKLFNKNFCTIYLFRHGETDWNTKKLVQGHTDIPLNKKGKDQAKEIAKKLRKINFVQVFSSDLIRAKRTTEIIIQEKKLAILTTKALRERDFGDFEGKSGKCIEVYRKAIRVGLRSLTKKERQLILKKNLGIETNEQMMARLIPFLREISVAYPGKNVLVVSHGGLMRALLIHLGYFPSEEESYQYIIKNTAGFILLSDGVDFFIKETWGIEKDV